MGKLCGGLELQAVGGSCTLGSSFNGISALACFKFCSAGVCLLKESRMWPKLVDLMPKHTHLIALRKAASGKDRTAII